MTATDHRSSPPPALLRALGVFELLLLAGAAALVAANLRGTADETLWAGIGALALWVGIRTLPVRLRTKGRLLYVTMALALLVGEGVVRLSADRLRGHLFTELPDSFTWVKDPVLHYTYRPGSPCGADGSRTATRRRICDVPHETSKPEGTYRIVVLGDSTSIFADPYDALWHQELQRRLNASRPAGWTFEIINGAVEGYNSRQQVALFERFLLELEPDLVIAAYCLNDPYPVVAHWQRPRSKLLRLSALLLQSIGLLSDSASDFKGLHENEETWGLVVTAYERLRSLADERGFRLAGFVMPEMTPDDDRGALYAQVEALFRRVGVETLDVHSDLTRDDKVRFHVPHDTLHPTEAFHARVGERMAEFLAERGLLPAAADERATGSAAGE